MSASFEGYRTSVRPLENFVWLSKSQICAKFSCVFSLFLGFPEEQSKEKTRNEKLWHIVFLTVFTPRRQFCKKSQRKMVVKFMTFWTFKSHRNFSFVDTCVSSHKLTKKVFQKMKIFIFLLVCDNVLWENTQNKRQKERKKKILWEFNTSISHFVFESIPSGFLKKNNFFRGFRIRHNPYCTSFDTTCLKKKIVVDTIVFSEN